MVRRLLDQWGGGIEGRLGEIAMAARISVGRRLSLLVVGNAIAMAVIVVSGAVALESARAEDEFDREYVFPPIEEIEKRLETDVAALRELADVRGPDVAERAHDPVHAVRHFAGLYRARWQLEDATDPAAAKMRTELERRGAFAVIEEEKLALETLDGALQNLERTTGMHGPPADPPVAAEDVRQVRAALLMLDNASVKRMRAAWAYAATKQVTTLSALVVVALLSFLSVPIMGLAVRRAIAPRLVRLVEKVRRFRELGVLEPFEDPGGDEIAVLAHALDVSFSAIVDRDRERAHFLAAAAHELKTPLMSINGYADLALTRLNDTAHLRRALEVISRQSKRLGRLSQDLLWVARARQGRLPFQPTPTDLVALVRRVTDDVNIAAKSRSFSLANVDGEAHLLLDPSLMEHALWTVLSYAVAISAAPTPIELSLEDDGMRVRLSVRVREHDVLPDDLELLVEPFGVIQYEGRGDARDTGIGLHLCREIARLHHARFKIERAHEDGVIFQFEFRR